MPIISLIAAIDEQSGLGKDNALLCHLPADLKHFKQVTTGKPVIMGRKTFLSIGRPLPNRQNIVLTRQTLNIKNVVIAHSLSEALHLTANEKEIMIIGGESVYKEALLLADNVYLTIIHHRFDADVFFPALDFSIWNCASKQVYQRDERNLFSMTFCHYQRR